jgi:Protein of unknown function (DUF3048) N-terminal domain/Protein of unknown function (DUF3048) C-terminal domain
MVDDFVQPPKKRPKIDTNTLDEKAAPEPTFKTPEQAAAGDLYDDEVDMGVTDAPKPEKPQKDSRVKAWAANVKAWFLGLNKWQKAAVIAAILLVLGLIGFGAYALTSDNEEPKKPVVKTATELKKEPVSDTVASALTGRQVPPAINKLPVTAVMVENSTDARPQSGLYDAGVVFEAIAEGGITRFIALYQDTSPTSVGPIRSVRPYYIDWARGFDAPIAHVGGSPEALARIKSERIKDLDQSFNAGSYDRVKSKPAPHNVFTSIERLNQLEQNKGYNTSAYTGFARKKDAAAKVPTAKTVNLAISSALYNVSYAYDTATNSYLRNLAGKPHVDGATSKQINPKVVIAMVVPYSIQSDGKHSAYGTVGSGEVIVFQDGVATKGTWAKPSVSSNITFKDTAGKAITLNAGQTWISVVSASNKISYLP